MGPGPFALHNPAPVGAPPLLKGAVAPERYLVALAPSNTQRVSLDFPNDMENTILT